VTPNQKRTLILLTGAFLLCAGLIKFFPANEPPDPLQALFPNVEATDVARLTISEEEKSVLLLLNEGKWTTTDHLAETRRVEEAVGELLSLKIKGPIKVEGMQVRMSVSVSTAQGAEHSLFFGQNIPGGTGVYVKTEMGIFATDRTPFSQAILGEHYFRSRRVFTGARSQTSGIRLRGPLSVHIHKSSFGWVLNEGLRTIPADGDRVERFLDTLFDLRFDAFASSPPPNTQPTIQIELLDSDEKVIDGTRLTLMPPWLASRKEGPWLPSTSGLDAWQAFDVNTFARRSVVWVEPSQVVRMTIEHQGESWEDTRTPTWQGADAAQVLDLLGRESATWIPRHSLPTVGSVKLGLIGNVQDLNLLYSQTSDGHLLWTPAGAAFSMRMAKPASAEFLAIADSLH